MTANLFNAGNSPIGNQIDGYVYPQFLFDPKRAPTVNDIYPSGTRWQDNSVVPKVIYETVGQGQWGLLPSSPVVVGAGASPQRANAKSGVVTFSGVSIAAGATQSFVINDSSAGTAATVSMVGATAGSALSIQSITYVAGTSMTIVVANGTGATTSTANITFTFNFLN